MKQTKKVKNAKQVERHMKGAANHYRIEIMLLLAKDSGLTLDQITRTLHANAKTISAHTGRLVQAGLVNKKYKGRTVEHSLSPYGKIFVRFIKKFQHS